MVLSPTSSGVGRGVAGAAGLTLGACAAAGVVAALRGTGPLLVLGEALALPLTAAVVGIGLFAAVALSSARGRALSLRPSVGFGVMVVAASAAYLAMQQDGARRLPPVVQAAPPVRVPAPVQQPPLLEPPRHPIGTSDAGVEQPKPDGQPPAGAAPADAGSRPRGGSRLSRPDRQDTPVRPRPPAAPRPVRPRDPAPPVDQPPGVPSTTSPAFSGPRSSGPPPTPGTAVAIGSSGAPPAT